MPLDRCKPSTPCLHAVFPSECRRAAALRGCAPNRRVSLPPRTPAAATGAHKRRHGHRWPTPRSRAVVPAAPPASPGKSNPAAAGGVRDALRVLPGRHPLGPRPARACSEVTPRPPSPRPFPRSRWRTERGCARHRDPEAAEAVGGAGCSGLYRPSGPGERPEPRRCVRPPRRGCGRGRAWRWGAAILCPARQHRGGRSGACSLPPILMPQGTARRPCWCGRDKGPARGAGRGGGEPGRGVDTWR